MQLKISVVIPVYNGSATIIRLVEELVSTFKHRFDLEIVLVNDCSSDNSCEVCVNIQNKFSDIVKFYNLAKNVGEHNATMAGLGKSNGDFVVIMDDDFQNPISEVVKLVEYGIDSDYDVVYTFYEEKKHSLFRNLGSAFNDKVANVMLNKPKNLYLSSFKLMNRFIVEEVVKYSLPFPYIDGLILRTTSNIGTLKVFHAKREEGQSNYTVKKLVSLWSNMFVNFSILPLRIMMGVGFLFALFAFCVGVFVVYEKFTNPVLPLGYPSLIITALFLSGVQMLFFGVLGEYLGRMFLSQNKTPQYTIRDSYE